MEFIVIILERAIVAPITEEERFQNGIEVSRVRAVEGNRTNKAICIL